jgi:serine/threonine-protein kinase
MLGAMAEPMTGTLVGSRYRLEHLIGRGGMAAVWVAEDETLHRWVALKLLGPQYADSPSAAERFEREARAIAQLRSPHVVQVFDYGIDGGRSFLVMELLNGEDLYTWLKRHRPVPLADVARIVVQVAKALGAAHRAGIVHRDLKPANIFVVRDHDEEVIKVFDFGLAKGLDPLHPLRDQTAEGVLIGTPRYMSPEQAHGARRVDHRTDLWSLAVVAYLGVVGRLPFRGRGVGEVITKIATEPAPRPSETAPGTPPGLDAFFERALAKNPDQRFQSASELAAAFLAALGIEAVGPLSLPPGSFVPRGRSEPPPSGEPAVPSAEPAAAPEALALYPAGAGPRSEPTAVAEAAEDEEEALEALGRIVVPPPRPSESGGDTLLDEALGDTELVGDDDRLTTRLNRPLDLLAKHRAAKGESREGPPPGAVPDASPTLRTAVDEPAPPPRVAAPPALRERVPSSEPLELEPDPSSTRVPPAPPRAARAEARRRHWRWLAAASCAVAVVGIVMAAGTKPDPAAAGPSAPAGPSAAPARPEVAPATGRREAPASGREDASVPASASPESAATRGAARHPSGSARPSAEPLDEGPPAGGGAPPEDERSLELFPDRH